VQFSAEATIDLGIAEAEFLPQRSDQRPLHCVPQPVESM
jgi:hypothetical protein